MSRDDFKRLPVQRRNKKDDTLAEVLQNEKALKTQSTDLSVNPLPGDDKPRRCATGELVESKPAR